MNEREKLACRLDVYASWSAEDFDNLVDAQFNCDLREAAAFVRRLPDTDEQLPLPTLLWERDKFIVSKGLWQDFVDQLPHGTDVRLPCDENPTALSPDAREALTFLAELDGGLERTPMPVAGSEECYPGPDVPTRIVQAAVRVLNREPADKPIGAEAIERLYRPWRGS